MGIAGFYLWLQRGYQECIEDVPQDVVDEALRVISENKQSPAGQGAESDSRQNPTGEEQSQVGGKTNSKKKKKANHASSKRNDIFYVDMNGLIHPCCHDTHPLPEPENEEEMLERCFDQLDLLVRVVRPQKCLVLCIDGVAPRSKMNQQRSRRFRAAEERLESDAIAAACADEIVQRYNVPRPRVRERWDSNVITPSTSFMERVGQALEWFVMKKINEDPLWKPLIVTFSDAHVPGEGEHKIMQYIRGLRASPGYDPSTTHVIHGMDADLICLGLATHELHVRILRNQLTETYQPDHSRFTYFNLETYRKCLERDFGCIENMDFERVLDDFVFLCFFVGNDFLPHVPLISIKTKGIELLLDHYVRYFPEHYYLTKNGEIHFGRLRTFLQNFVQTSTGALKREYRGVERAKERAKQNVEDRVDEAELEMESVAETLTRVREEEGVDQEDGGGGSGTDHFSPASSPTRAVGSPTSPTSSSLHEISDMLFALLTSIRKERSRLVADTQTLPFSYLSNNYQAAYYYSKFGWPEAEESAVRCDPEAFRKRVNECCEEYFRGMQWVMRYYTHGCPSWEWFYPFHYAPLIEDLAAFEQNVNVSMKKGAPLHPVQQLLAVLPRLSVHALPPELHEAVKNPTSVLARFYPDTLDVDYSEANFSYQGVLRIPFVDCDEMRMACEKLVKLEEDVGMTLALCHESSPFAARMDPLLCAARRRERGDEENKQAGEDAEDWVRIPAALTAELPIAGHVNRTELGYPHHQKLTCPDEGLLKVCCPFSKPIEHNEAKCFLYAPLENTMYLQRLLTDSSKRGKPEKKRMEEVASSSGPNRGGRKDSAGNRKRGREDEYGMETHNASGRALQQRNNAPHHHQSHPTSSHSQEHKRRRGEGVENQRGGGGSHYSAEEYRGGVLSSKGVLSSHSSPPSRDVGVLGASPSHRKNHGVLQRPSREIPQQGVLGVPQAVYSPPSYLYSTSASVYVDGATGGGRSGNHPYPSQAVYTTEYSQDPRLGSSQGGGKHGHSHGHTSHQHSRKSR